MERKTDRTLAGRPTSFGFVRRRGSAWQCPRQALQGTPGSPRTLKSNDFSTKLAPPYPQACKTHEHSAISIFLSSIAWPNRNSMNIPWNPNICSPEIAVETWIFKRNAKLLTLRKLLTSANYQHLRSFEPFDYMYIFECTMVQKCLALVHLEKSRNMKI